MPGGPFTAYTPARLRRHQETDRIVDRELLTRRERATGRRRPTARRHGTRVQRSQNHVRSFADIHPPHGIDLGFCPQKVAQRHADIAALGRVCDKFQIVDVETVQHFVGARRLVRFDLDALDPNRLRPQRLRDAQLFGEPPSDRDQVVDVEYLARSGGGRSGVTRAGHASGLVVAASFNSRLRCVRSIFREGIADLLDHLRTGLAKSRTRSHAQHRRYRRQPAGSKIDRDPGACPGDQPQSAAPALRAIGRIHRNLAGPDPERHLTDDVLGRVEAVQPIRDARPRRQRPAHRPTAAREGLGAWQEPPLVIHRKAQQRTIAPARGQLSFRFGELECLLQHRPHGSNGEHPGVHGVSPNPVLLSFPRVQPPGLPRQRLAASNLEHQVAVVDRLHLRWAEVFDSTPIPQNPCLPISLPLFPPHIGPFSSP